MRAGWTGRRHVDLAVAGLGERAGRRQEQSGADGGHWGDGAFVIGSWYKGALAIRLLAWRAIGVGVIDLAIFNYPAVIGGMGLGLGLVVMVGVPATAFGTGFTATIQMEAEDAYRERVFGALNTTMALLMIVGASLAGAVTERLGAVTVLTVQSLSYVGADLFDLEMLGGWNVSERRVPVMR